MVMNCEDESNDTHFAKTIRILLILNPFLTLVLRLEKKDVDFEAYHFID
jgi:hypothetical protein